MTDRTSLEGGVKEGVQPRRTEADRGCIEPAALLKLAERCEREQPSRELDAEICFAVYPDRQRVSQAAGFVMADTWWSGNGGSTIWEYTSSLDAAVTLVPAQRMGGSHHHPESLPGSPCADPHWYIECAGNRAWAFAGKGVYAARTPALAICAAALRARCREEPGAEPGNTNLEGDSECAETASALLFPALARPRRSLP